jgi:hypothetical protein
MSSPSRDMYDPYFCDPEGEIAARNRYRARQRYVYDGEEMFDEEDQSDDSETE